MLVVPVAIGLGTGSATAVLQGVLSVPWAALANAASPWLAAAFVAGVLAARHGVAAVAGAVTCVGAVLGYYLTAVLRGGSAAESTVFVWVLCGIIAGPVLGEAGQAWKRGRTLTRLLASSLLAACFLLEGLRYEVVLDYGSRAVLFGVIAAAIAVAGIVIRPPRIAHAA
jgi:hypothetical protein